jgi:cell division protein FtsQ
VTLAAPEREPEPPRTSTRWKILALILLLILLAPASWLARRAASRMEFFHLRAVTVEGTRYLSPESVVERLALDTMRSVWDDTAPLVERLRTMSQVSDVRIARRLPGTLVITIKENLPVALAPSPRGLEPLDTAGTVLPIDPATEQLDLPVAAQRDVSILSLLGSIRSGDPRLYQRISEVSRDGRSALVIRLEPLADMPRGAMPTGIPDTVNGHPLPHYAGSLRVRAPLGVSVSRLADIFPVESDLVRRRANVAELDLRYRDQVIARLQ